MPKPVFVRVKDKASRHEFTVAAHAVRAHHEVIDKPAVDPTGKPLPPKPHVQISAAPTARRRPAAKKRTRRKSPAPVAPTEPESPADEQKEG